MSGGIFRSHGEILKINLRHRPTKSIIKTKPEDVVMNYLLGVLTIPCIVCLDAMWHLFSKEIRKCKVIK